MKILFKMIISCLLFGYLTFWVDWRVTIGAFKHIDLKLFLLSTVFAGFTTVVISAKFYFLIINTDIARSFSTMVKINFISRFYGLFLPSSLGKATARWYIVTKNRKGRSFFIAATIVERTTFMLTLLVFCSVAIFFYTSNPQILKLKPYIWPFILALFIGTLSVMTYLLYPGFHNRIKSFIRIRIEPYTRFKAVGEFLENFSLKNSSVTLLRTLLTLSVIWHFFFILRMFFIFQSLSVPIPFYDIIWMSSLVLLIQMIPISFSGIGLREGAYTILLLTADLPAENGILIGILFFSQMLLFALVGGIFELCDN